MADPAQRWSDNSPGRFFVDRECIDCDLCRTTAPDNFARSEEGFSYVLKQPASPAQLSDCQEALAGCPVDAIGDSV